MEKFTTKSFSETQVIGQDFAKQILTADPKKTAVILALQGDLGAGKTTFLQGFAKGLGITENILSPTFVIMKKFPLANSGFEYFYHFDCYRLNDASEVIDLGFKEIISNPKNIIAIEWPEKISKYLPKDIVLINFDHLEENKRELTIHN